MSHFLTPDGFQYPACHTLTFDADRLAFQCCCHIDGFSEPSFAPLARSFIAAPDDQKAYTRLQEEVRSLLRDAYERGQFALYVRQPPTVPRHERLLLIDRVGGAWTFVRAAAGHTYRFNGAFCRAAAGDPLLAAARSARNRFVRLAGAGPTGETWSKFRFGWADFWRVGWQPPLPVVANPLAPR